MRMLFEEYYKQILLEERVGGNYLFHSVEDAATAKAILKSEYFRGNTNSHQHPTLAQVGKDMPVVSFGRNLDYQLSGKVAGRDYKVVFVVDRDKLEQRYKTIGTSQSYETRGAPFRQPDTDLGGPAGKLKIHMRRFDTNKDGRLSPEEIRASGAPWLADIIKKYNTAKHGKEFEEVVPSKNGKIPWGNMLVGFYLVPGKSAADDPYLKSHPLRLDMPRPNTFVKHKDA
jgi:hypothetical protein